MNATLKVIIAMVMWGSLGVFVKNIELESFEIAFLRGLIASIFLGIILFIKHKKSASPDTCRDESSMSSTTLAVAQNHLDSSTTKDNLKTHSILDVYSHSSSTSLKSTNLKALLILILSGACIGFNWVFLFQSYNYTTVSNATLGYYFAPVIVVLFSPIILKEKFTIKRFISVVAAMLGLFLIIGTQSQETTQDFNHLKGISMAITAACLYASVIILNKFTKDFSDYKRTFIQLFTATIVLLPFIIFRDQLVISDTKTLVLILTLGILHTGIAYCLYFSAMKELKAQSTALLGYVDPVSAIFFSVAFLGEPLSIFQVVGGIIILASAFVAENS